jgi:hypothetical protein
LIPLLFSISALYGEADMFSVELGLEGLASFVFYFEIEGIGLRLAALIVMLVEAVSVAEVDAAGS